MTFWVIASLAKTTNSLKKQKRLFIYTCLCDNVCEQKRKTLLASGYFCYLLDTEDDVHLD